MKLLAFNGSPRKKWNTAQLLEHALEGAESEGAKTKLYHLYDLDFKGCISCFACKRDGGKGYGHCAVKDDLPGRIPRRIEKADAVLIGSPIYLGITTGVTRCFLERLFPRYWSMMRGGPRCLGKDQDWFHLYSGATGWMVQQMGVEPGSERYGNGHGEEYSGRANPSLLPIRSSSMTIQNMLLQFNTEAKRGTTQKAVPAGVREKRRRAGARLVRQGK